MVKRFVLMSSSLTCTGIANIETPPVTTQVLYLYDNKIESLEGLGRLGLLEQLHLDNNQITSIHSSLRFTRLTKLWVPRALTLVHPRCVHCVGIDPVIFWALQPPRRRVLFKPKDVLFPLARQYFSHGIT